MAFGLDDILWIIAGGTYVASRSTRELWEQTCDKDDEILRNRIAETKIRYVESVTDNELEKAIRDLVACPNTEYKDAIWAHLERFKRDNPMWIAYYYTSIQYVPIAECDSSRKRVSWGVIGRERPSEYDEEDVIDLLMQSFYRRSALFAKRISDSHAANLYISEEKRKKWRFEYLFGSRKD